jgi:hypothetical protein
MGASEVEIAEGWCIEPNSAAKKIKRGRLMETDSTATRPGLEVVTGAEAISLLGEVELLSEPRDPAEGLDELLVEEPAPGQWAQSRRRLIAAVQAGLPERVSLKVHLPAGPITVEIPTASREAARRLVDRAVQEHGGYGHPSMPCAIGGDDELAWRAATWLIGEDGWPPSR